jgi:hypothetical protein
MSRGRLIGCAYLRHIMDEGTGDMMTQALMFGLDVGIYGRLATRDHILELAALAESSGLESLWVADHVIFPKTFASPYPFYVAVIVKRF